MKECWLINVETIIEFEKKKNYFITSNVIIKWGNDYQ